MGSMITRQASSKEAAGPGAVGAARFALVLADDEILRHLLAAILGQRGFRVTLAAASGDALSRIERETFDLLVLDTNLTSPSSAVFLRQLRRRVGDSRPPILGLIMPGQSSLRDTVRRLGVAALISEPFEPSTLAESARRLAREAA